MQNIETIVIGSAWELLPPQDTADKTAQQAMDSAKERGDALLRRFESANR